MGKGALRSNTTGSENTASGLHALYANTTGYHNVGIGAYANLFNEEGSRNTIIGHGAGQGDTWHNKSDNIFIGYQAGFDETESNKLYIENSPSSTPLIGGDFSEDEIYLNGSVGIGTMNPAYKLDVAGNIFVHGVDGFNAEGEDAILHLGHPGHHIRGEFGTGVVINAFGTPHNYDMVINEFTGNVGIGGIVNPDARLYVNAGFGDMFTVTNGGASGTLIFQSTAPGIIGELGVGTLDPVYNLEINGTAGKPGGGSWSDSSDRRLKKNIQKLTGALNKLSRLEGVSFKWINPETHGEHTGIQTGLIAQDVEKVFPNWVAEVKPSGRDTELISEGDTIKALQFPHGFNAYLVEAIKELKVQNEVLSVKNQKLEERVEKLEMLLKPPMTHSVN